MKNKFFLCSLFSFLLCCLTFSFAYADSASFDSTSFNPIAVSVEARDTVPVGTVMVWTLSGSIPENWLECNGQSIPSEYDELIALVGSSTPNYAGAFLRGSGGDSGSMGVRHESNTSTFLSGENGYIMVETCVTVTESNGGGGEGACEGTLCGCRAEAGHHHHHHHHHHHLVPFRPERLQVFVENTNNKSSSCSLHPLSHPCYIHPALGKKLEKKSPGAFYTSITGLSNWDPSSQIEGRKSVELVWHGGKPH